MTRPPERSRLQEPDLDMLAAWPLACESIPRRLLLFLEFMVRFRAALPLPVAIVHAFGARVPRRRREATAWAAAKAQGGGAALEPGLSCF
jgi:hypothetical protein